MWKTFSDGASAALSQALHKKVIENSWMSRDTNCGAGGDSEEGNPEFRWKALESRSLFTPSRRWHRSRSAFEGGKAAAMITSLKDSAEGKYWRGWKTIEHTVGNEKKSGNPLEKKRKSYLCQKSQRDDLLSETNSDAENLCEDGKANAGSSLCLFPERASFFFLRLVCILHRSYIRSLFPKLLDTFLFRFCFNTKNLHIVKISRRERTCFNLSRSELTERSPARLDEEFLKSARKKLKLCKTKEKYFEESFLKK